MSYEDDRRLFHVMRMAGWTHDAATGGFSKPQRVGSPLWVSWDQAADALRLADDGVLPQSRTMTAIAAKASDDR